jgi:hypothetical protein
VPFCSKRSDNLIQYDYHNFTELNAVSAFAAENFPGNPKQRMHAVERRLFIAVRIDQGLGNDAGEGTKVPTMKCDEYNNTN